MQFQEKQVCKWTKYCKQLVSRFGGVRTDKLISAIQANPSRFHKVPVGPVGNMLRLGDTRYDSGQILQSACCCYWKRFKLATLSDCRRLQLIYCCILGSTRLEYSCSCVSFSRIIYIYIYFSVDPPQAGENWIYRVSILQEKSESWQLYLGAQAICILHHVIQQVGGFSGCTGHASLWLVEIELSKHEGCAAWVGRHLSCNGISRE